MIALFSASTAMGLFIECFDDWCVQATAFFAAFRGALNVLKAEFFVCFLL